MVSELHAKDYEGRLRELRQSTLEERRHQLDKQQVHRILSGKDRVKSDTLFKKASDRERVTRGVADPLNMRITVSRREVRKHFFLQRVPEKWNKIPPVMKNVETRMTIRDSYHKHRLPRRQKLSPDGDQD